MEKRKRNVYNIPPRSLAMKILSLSFLIATILFSLAFNCSEQKNDQPKNNAQGQPGQNPNAAGQEQLPPPPAYQDVHGVWRIHYLSDIPGFHQFVIIRNNRHIEGDLDDYYWLVYGEIERDSAVNRFEGGIVHGNESHLFHFRVNPDGITCSGVVFWGLTSGAGEFVGERTNLVRRRR